MARLFKTDLEKSVIVSNLEKRGFERTTDENVWDFYWAEKSSIRQIYNPENGIRLADNQVINHFPNHFELTRKDLLVKNFKRYRKDLEREGSPLAAKDQAGNYIHLDLIPQTYLLPSDFSLFQDEFRKNPNSVWILKPNARSQGSGIVIVNKLAQVKKWAASKLQNLSSKESYLASKYVENPLLIGNKKFDLRLYVLVTSYKPLKVYFCKNGFARFCNVAYSTDFDDLDNQYIHLTNVAIQKKGSDYNSKHGNKWHVENLRLYLESIYGNKKVVELFDNIENLVLQSLKAVQGVMMSDKHCFECYGYDVLIDSALKPWLLEVNGSRMIVYIVLREYVASLSTTTDSDRVLKQALLNDIFEIVFPPDFPNCKIPINQSGLSWNKEPNVGAFYLLYDELEELQKEQPKNKDKIRASSNLWK